ncbi:hypothetical protein [Blastopirellula marina]|uniref:Prepilin-type cleavage/methylation domain-containing protein n=1 Tax=Blastopirellula marina TaxID=124 RepID=A0A2S8FHE9_9BACT|nr:hypothetical protein [Blastopirellula marina]PQO31573.1 hypothetical protein C5Y98_19330 [Blastopirellula marina]PTL42879.1 hypothetical protein C5Y97_19340 [Blastopirellula marina]
MSVVECVMALAVMGAMLTTLLSIQVVQSTRLGLDNQRMRAEQTLGNLADRILAAKSEQLTVDSLTAWAQEAEQEENLPANTIQVVVHTETNPIKGQRIELIWQPPTKQLPSHRLVVWRFAAESSPVEEDPA